jgi:cell division transport system ATP-binding protein
MATIVQFDNVGLRYGTGAETLSDLSFSLQRGAFYFLTGPSGAGKTSLLRLLYLALRPIGVVFQDFRLVPHLTAFENVALPLRLAGTAEQHVTAPVKEMLAWVGLEDRINARPDTLSGGEQQRVAIARAVIGRPDVLVADEPTGNVDPDMAQRLLHLFDGLNRLGTTVVVATHDLHLLSRIGTAEMMRLDKGRLSDPTGALRHPPLRSDPVPS